MTTTVRFALAALDPGLRRSLERGLVHLGVHVCSVDAEHLEAPRLVDFHAVVADLDVANEASSDAIALLERVQRVAPHVTRILVGSRRTLRAHRALDDGIAQHFFAKPFGLTVVTQMVSAARPRGS